MQLRAKYVVVCNGISDVNHTFMGRAVFLNLCWDSLKKVGYVMIRSRIGIARVRKSEE